MQPQQPSLTAFAAAGHRAAHQVLEAGAVFADPLAVRILGVGAEQIADHARARPEGAGMRFFIAARTALAEAKLAEAVERRGVRQLVVLGAGLDTFAWRNPFADRLRVFEVDHPATQAWKRKRVAELGFPPAPSLTFAPVDFETDSLAAGLEAAGFDPTSPSSFTWLGVVPYLTLAAVDATLAFIAGLPGGGEVVFDYGEAAEALSPELRAAHEERAARVAQLGEPFLTSFDPPALHRRLRSAGFGEIEDSAVPDLVMRFLGEDAHAALLARGRTNRGGHVLWARAAPNP